MVSPSASTTARNKVFSSWRIFPGQGKAASTRSASGVIRRMRLPSSAAKPRQKMPGQRRDIGGPFAQRRHRDREHVQAIEQVFAEAAGFDVGDQVAIGGRDDADVDLDQLAGADRLDLALLDGAQQLDLGRGRQLADLVEEQGAAGRLDELADMALGGAGERALLVAEQDRLDQVFRHGAAIHRDERFCAPLARAVDGARDQFLADAGLARDQHRDMSTSPPSPPCAAPPPWRATW